MARRYRLPDQATPRAGIGGCGVEVKRAVPLAAYQHNPQYGPIHRHQPEGHRSARIYWGQPGIGGCAGKTGRRSVPLTSGVGRRFTMKSRPAQPRSAVQICRCPPGQIPYWKPGEGCKCATPHVGVGVPYYFGVPSIGQRARGYLTVDDPIPVRAKKKPRPIEPIITTGTRRPTDPWGRRPQPGFYRGGCPEGTRICWNLIRPGYIFCGWADKPCPTSIGMGQRATRARGRLTLKGTPRRRSRASAVPQAHRSKVECVTQGGSRHCTIDMGNIWCSSNGGDWACCVENGPCTNAPPSPEILDQIADMRPGDSRVVWAPDHYYRNVASRLRRAYR